MTLPTRDHGWPPIILVHAAANSAAVWTYWTPKLAAEGWPVYSLDLRGHSQGAPLDLSLRYRASLR